MAIAEVTEYKDCPEFSYRLPVLQEIVAADSPQKAIRLPAGCVLESAVAEPFGGFFQRQWKVTYTFKKDETKSSS